MPPEIAAYIDEEGVSVHELTAHHRRDGDIHGHCSHSVLANLR